MPRLGLTLRLHLDGLLRDIDAALAVDPRAESANRRLRRARAEIAAGLVEGLEPTGPAHATSARPVRTI